ncbi:CoA pyrophosphatase [Sphingorhabdus arenilitoris]|uniref:CoA pyrophosphatase n=1 Tax=Sphingorhabdus arenilitoris TaxID=1490041 RepID=A0ABV8RH89_9SPHN
MSLIQRITAAIDPAIAITVEDERYLGDAVAAHRAAAVLIPITDRAEPGVILTQRPDNLRSHAGQVAFPGGKIDADDNGPIGAALREAEEELAIPSAQVQVIGATDDYFSGSGYRITPVLGMIPPDLTLVPNPGEVEDWFEVPLSFLLDPANVQRKSAVWMGRERQYYDMQWQDRRIWGVTAGIIANLARRMRAL